jgi:hypothetical protein
LDTLTIAKTPSQEAAMVVKSPEAPANKGTPARASKRLKKAAAESASLDTHRPVASCNTPLLLTKIKTLLKYFILSELKLLLSNVLVSYECMSS